MTPQRAVTDDGRMLEWAVINPGVREVLIRMSAAPHLAEYALLDLDLIIAEMYRADPEMVMVSQLTKLIRHPAMTIHTRTMRVNDLERAAAFLAATTKTYASPPEITP